MVCDKIFVHKNVRAAEIYRQIVKMYGENVMGVGIVREWCRLLFKDGGTNLLPFYIWTAAVQSRPSTQWLLFVFLPKEILGGQSLQNGQETKDVVQV